MQALMRYRQFILGSVSRELKERYRRTSIGQLWLVLNPLVMILVYTLVFSQVMKARLPGQDQRAFAYGIYLCAGLLTWGLFSELLARLQDVFISNANLLKKTSFPRSCLPVIAVLTALANFAIIFSLFLVFLLIIGQFPGTVALWALPVLAVQLTFAVGLGVLVGVLNVFFRDVGQMFGVILQLWFWLTPIVYVADILSSPIRTALAWNPMAPVIRAYQGIFLSGIRPDLASLTPVLVGGAALCLLASALFRRVAGEMVDEL